MEILCVHPINKEDRMNLSGLYFFLTSTISDIDLSCIYNLGHRVKSSVLVIEDKNGTILNFLTVWCLNPSLLFNEIGGV